ncbi:MAG TPA: threonine/serine exporter family protein [Chloroflexota bacterium]|nr:threonine/serine exporter family protein [Chloroflexota bacterium]
MNGWLLVHDLFWSTVAALGFAVMFNVPRRLLPGCALAGGLGHALRALVMGLGLPLEVATLAAATAVGFLSEWLAKRYQSPRIVFGVAGVIPMVPGVLAYQTMLGVFELAGLINLTNSPAAEELVSTAVLGIKTGLVLITLALGIIAPNLLFRRQQPVV